MYRPPEIQEEISRAERDATLATLKYLHDSPANQAISSFVASEIYRRSFIRYCSVSGKRGRSFLNAVVNGTIELVDARGRTLRGPARATALKELQAIAADIMQLPSSERENLSDWLLRNIEKAKVIHLAELYHRFPPQRTIPSSGPPPGTVGGYGGGDLSALTVGGLGGAPGGQSAALAPGSVADTGLTPAQRTMVLAHTLLLQEQMRAVPEIGRQVTRESGNTMRSLGGDYLEGIAGIVNNPNGSSGAAAIGSG